MTNYINKIKENLKQFLNRKIIAVCIDNQFINDKLENDYFGEKIKIYFSENEVIKLYTDDIPHFYGEGDIEFEIIKNNELLTTNFINKNVSEIRIFGWKPNGIFVLDSSQYFVQIEFFQKNDLILSLGFFYLDFSLNKVSFLSSGNLSVSTKNNLSIITNNKNLNVFVLKS